MAVDGQPMARAVGGSGDAIVFVQIPTDAVKSVSGSQVVSSLDREDMWQIVGFDLSRSVVEQVLIDETQDNWLAALDESAFVVEFIELPAVP